MLEIKPVQKDELKSLRQYIRSSFDEIGCCLFPHPGDCFTNFKTELASLRTPKNFFYFFPKIFPTNRTPKKSDSKKEIGADLQSDSCQLCFKIQFFIQANNIF